MATITEPMALDKTFNTTETTPRSQADVLAAIENAIRQGMGRSAADVSYDNTTSGLTADDVQEAVDELAAEKVDKVEGKGLSSNDFTDEDKAALDGMELDIASTQTATGNPITLENVAPINAEKLVVEFSPKQDLHGQSAPYVGGVGENKLPLDLATMKSLNSGGTWSGNVYTHNNGVTFTVLTDSDGNVTGIKANGTASVTLSFVICNVTYSSGSFYLKGLTDYGNGSSRFNLRLTSGGTTISDYFSESGTEFSVTESTTFLCAINVYGGYTCSNLMFYPMVRLSSVSDTTFEKWSNICPITGYTECSVDDVGKNLWGGEKLANDILDTFPYSTQDTTNKTVTYAAWNVDGKTLPFNAFKPNTRYTIILKYSCSVAGAYANLVVFYTDNSYTALSVPNTAANTVITHSFVTDENKTVKSISGGFYDGSTTVYYEESGVFEGLVPTADFEPYQSTSASIQFGQTVYGGSADFSGGTDVKKGKYACDGTETAAAMTAPHVYRMSDQFMRSFNVIGTTPVCSHYKGVLFPSSTANLNNGECCVYEGAYGNTFAVRDDSIASAEDFEAFLLAQYTAGKPVEISLPLYTESTISTPATPLRLLKGTNNITTNGTTIQLGYQPDNVIGELKEDIKKCAVDAEFMQFTDGTDTFTDVNLSLNGSLHTVSVVGAKIEQKRFICFEVMDKMGGVLQGILASGIAFTDGAKTPSGTAFRAYIESVQMYVNFRIHGSGGSYTLSYQSETSFSASAFYVRVRMMNNL